MTIHNRILLFVVGVVFWLLGTAWYRLQGARIFESAPTRFWVNFLITPIATAVLCIGILRWLAIPQPEWASAMLLLALPGIFGEALVLARFTTVMPSMQPASAGLYAAFLFTTYGFVLAIAEIATLVSKP